MNGQIGNGGVPDPAGQAYLWASVQVKPQPVTGLKNVVAVAARAAQSMALQADGTVWAWGGNEHGQLGVGTLDATDRPVRVTGLDKVSQISAGSAHGLALRSDGSLRAWGDNTFGAVGNGSSADATCPIAISLPGATAPNPAPQPTSQPTPGPPS